MIAANKMVSPYDGRFMRGSLKILGKRVKILLTESRFGVIILVYCIGVPCRFPINLFLNKNP
jgi:hypothetical protein